MVLEPEPNVFDEVERIPQPAFWSFEDEQFVPLSTVPATPRAWALSVGK